MFLVAITNWKKKLVLLISTLLLLILVVTIIPVIHSSIFVNSNSAPDEEDILSQPIKVQSEPTNQETPQKK